MTNKSIPVIRLAGKASVVFKEIELAARYRGDTTIRQLAELPVREFDFDEWGRLQEIKEREENDNDEPSYKF